MAGLVKFEITMSLDGYVAGPNPTLKNPLGEGGERLHEWAVETKAWREAHGMEGGETGQESDVLGESFAREGATVMGRKMFSGGSGPWQDDPNAEGWWGEDPPFHNPVFVLTHHEREPLEMQGGTTFHFVTGGVEEAVARAREAAGEMDVGIGGGASAGQQALAAGLVDELVLHIAPVLLGGGTRLFEGLGLNDVRFEPVEARHSPRVTHIRYRVAR